MPFDGFLRAPPTLDKMPAILRDRSRWPEGFKWDYRSSENCAIGLGTRMGAKPLEWVVRLEEDASYVFSRPEPDGEMKNVTPEIVAARLERVLPKYPAPSKALATFAACFGLFSILLPLAVG